MLDESRPRRSWTRVEKAAITAQVGVDGATLFDVAQSHGVGRYLLKRWMAQYCDSNTSENTKAPLFVPVVVTDPEPSGPVVIEVGLGNGRSLRVSSDLSDAQVRRFIGLVEAT
ncbi:transposase [Pseudovibrio sp. Tun.PSC04-5.I4]|uniref:transposase n=1 Tax=Pseudovibrio sp. Tun.PSC04-5.I4 TaxID=1798213 RepID=UPI000888516E|nr:transposase [Pseudovibrio sp. Tun.PSC04-5.I4]SDR49340.1 Transposase [Pseudovibrio sp. Tun.PSC04-5.I4]